MVFPVPPMESTGVSAPEAPADVQPDGETSADTDADLDVNEKTICVAGFFNTTYTEDRIRQILTAAGAQVVDRRSIDRASILLAGGRIGSVQAKAESLGMSIRGLSWLQAIEALHANTQTPTDQPKAPSSPKKKRVPVPSAFANFVLPEEDHELIPKATGRYEWCGLDRLIGSAIRKNRHVLLVGGAGTGKSSAVMETAALTNHKMLRINLTGQTTTSDLIGHHAANNGSTYWVDGVLPLAMRMGAWLLIDEIDMGDPEILASLHMVLEEGGYLLLKENNNEVVRPAEGFRILATANSLGLHDECGNYSGTRAMNAALLNRFAVLRVTAATESVETRILASRGIHTEVAELVVKAGTAVRKLIEAGTVTGVWSVRNLLDFAEFSMDLGNFEEGFMMAAGGKFTDTEFKALWETAQRITSKNLPAAATQASAA